MFFTDFPSANPPVCTHQGYKIFSPFPLYSLYTLNDQKSQPFQVLCYSLFWETLMMFPQLPLSIAVAQNMALSLTSPCLLDLQAFYISLLEHTWLV